MPNDDNPFRRRKKIESDNPFTREARQEPILPTVSEAGALARSGINQFANNALAAPSVVGDIAGTGLAQTAAVLGAGQGGDLFERIEHQKGVGLASSLRSVPRPTVQDIDAGLRSVPSLLPGGEKPGERFAREKESVLAEEAAIAKENPKATGVGKVLGDVATLFTLRLPAAQKIKQFEQALMKIGPVKVQNKFLKQADAVIVQSESLRKLLRGAGRSVEVGFEAVALDMLQGDDPFETAGWAAGTQLAGSGVLHGLDLVKQNKGLAGAAFAGFVAWQAAKQITPGADTSVATFELGESFVANLDKIILGGVFAAMTGAAGLGRFRSGKRNFETNMPVFADAITSVPRAAIISAMETLNDAPPEVQNDPNAAIQYIMEAQTPLPRQ